MSGLNQGYDICEWVRAANRDGIRAVDGPTVGRWLEACSSQGLPTAPVRLESLDEEMTERLRSLGYVD